MEQIQEKYGTIEKWGSLTDGKTREVNAKALIYGLLCMMNEGIEINNDEKGMSDALLDHKQVGRIITKVGLQSTAQKINEAIINATKDDIPKNE